MAAMPTSLRLFLRTLKRAPKVYLNGYRDISRYVRQSAILGSEGHLERMRGVITATYHNIEKGLSLPVPRAGFGAANIAKLTGLIDLYLNDFGADEFITVPIGVLESYIAFNKRRNFDVSTLEANVGALRKRLEPLIPLAKTGVMAVNKSEIMAVVSPVTGEFFLRRHSVRRFSTEEVTAAQIQFAAQAAQKAPGVCNRQSGRIRVISEKTKIASTLAIQSGARGFGDNVPMLFCISVDISNFNGIGERYQGWIDGGLFAMSFLFGLHAQGIGACCLNWSKDHEQDNEMRKHLDLPDNELIIMFIAAGHLPEEFEVACSYRRPLDEVLVGQM